MLEVLSATGVDETRKRVLTMQLKALASKIMQSPMGNSVNDAIETLKGIKKEVGTMTN